MSEPDETVACTACGVVVPFDRTATLQTPHGGMTVCVACHPTKHRPDTPFAEAETDET